MSICLNAGGGLGDILRVYLSGDVGYPWCQPYWGQLEQWRDDTGEKIKLVVASHNPSAADFFKYVPWIDEIIAVPWVNSGTLLPAQYAGEGYTPLKDWEVKDLCSSYTWKQPKIYLAEDELEEYLSIVQNKKYAVIYPFGSYGARMCSSRYHSLVQKMIQYGYVVVIVGDSYVRNVTGDTKFIPELFDYNHDNPNIINLVGRNSCRLTSLVTLNADLYIGSLGCYMHAAFGNYVKSTILTCYEIWENNDVFGSNILRNDSLWYLRKFVGAYKNFVDLVSINNEDDIENLWDRVIQRMSSSNGISSELIFWGDSGKKRKFVNV